MFFRFLLVAALVGGFLPAEPAAAAVVGDASVPYSATQIVTVDGKTYSGNVFHTPGRQREDVDINGIPITFLLQIADDRAVVILPALVSYMELPLPPLLAELDRHRLAGKAVGEDVVNGMHATRYRIDYRATDGSRGEGSLWLTRENILLRIDGRIMRKHHRPIRVTMRLTDLKVGPQQPSLFMVSKGLHKVPERALQIILALRDHKH